jgi:hypothetical protein
MKTLLLLLGLLAAVAARGQTLLTWNADAASSAVTNYAVFSAAAGSTNYALFQNVGLATNCAIGGGGTSYYVRAQNAFGTSGPSAVVTNLFPDTPAGVRVSVTIQLNMP